jgi:hypothetical protein
MQNLLLLIGPPFYAVSIYMVLGRLIAVLNAEKYSIIKLKWLTKFFLVGDVLSILAQAAGKFHYCLSAEVNGEQGG